MTNDSVSYVTSGLLTEDRKKIVSHLHKGLKPINQLRMMEDALVIYRLARAPERRMFYIDVGNLPRGKAEQYMKDIMARYRNKLVYDAKTGRSVMTVNTNHYLRTSGYQDVKVVEALRSAHYQWRKPRTDRRHYLFPKENVSFTKCSDVSIRSRVGSRYPWQIYRN